jgi:dTDP-4-dehydrorhamnose reductase
MPSLARVAIVGASGQLGRAIVAERPPGVIAAPAHAQVALEDEAALAALLDDAQPAVLINCAAFHHVDACEREPERALALNALAVGRAAALCEARGIAFVTISSDYVFAGTAGRAYREDDAAWPQTVYGISKLTGELLARRYPRTFVLRMSGIFGRAGSSNKGVTLIERVLGQAERGEPTRMVADVVFSPTYAPHAARAVWDLLDREAYGLHHVVNAGACSWYEFVQTAFRKAGLPDAPLAPVTYRELGNPTPRPLISPLENTTFAGLGIAPLPHWHDALDAYLAPRRERAPSA